eukprot:m.13019 g.13019  ORF g.13019 m.13019 type:complete len:187 (-) comp7127_c0_seq1:3942-4502(-)
MRSSILANIFIVLFCIVFFASSSLISTAMAEKSKVEVHLYDLSQGMAPLLSSSMFGIHLEAIWHTSIVVYGKEYFFGGGINCAHPGTTNAGTAREIVHLGETEIPEFMFIEYLHGLRDQFNVASYHLLRNNCNHFSETVANFLVGKSIPDKVLTLPDRFLATPMGQMFAPMIDQMFQQLGGNGAPV